MLLRLTKLISLSQNSKDLGEKFNKHFFSIDEKLSEKIDGTGLPKHHAYLKKSSRSSMHLRPTTPTKSYAILNNLIPTKVLDRMKSMPNLLHYLLQLFCLCLCYVQ